MIRKKYMSLTFVFETKDDCNSDIIGNDAFTQALNPNGSIWYTLPTMPVNLPTNLLSQVYPNLSLALAQNYVG